ncbi:hypothetical protein SNE40_018337 [Patella caerulea]|uniref:Uncharacterized protein n=1 Tax=Patella caerulea TaxID=87958 RepID=A0AAN8J7G9_PATCE
MSPFKALFGSDPKVGLRSLPLPDEIMERFVTEEDLLQALPSAETSPETASSETSSTSVTASAETSPKVATASAETSPEAPSAETSSTSATASTETSPTEAQQLDVKHSNIMSCRKRAADGIVTQAEIMIKRSRLINVAANPGDNVTVPIPRDNHVICVLSGSQCV